MMPLHFLTRLESSLQNFQKAFFQWLKVTFRDCPYCRKVHVVIIMNQYVAQSLHPIPVNFFVGCHELPREFVCILANSLQVIDNGMA